MTLYKNAVIVVCDEAAQTKIQRATMAGKS